jgi:SagB-type dehydrogenase family enzyme
MIPAMPQRYVISQFTIVSWRDGDVQVTSPMTGTTLTCDASVLAVLSSFAVPRTIDDVIAGGSSGADGVAALLQEWITAAVLVDADAPEPAALHSWDRDSLALHMSSRYRKWRKNPAATTPAVAPRRSEQAIPLASGSGSGGALAALLDARRSRRTWANRPIPFQTFSDLFQMCARNRATGREAHVSRPYPSGGARYSLELYPILANDAVDTLLPGVYRYLPEVHALEVVAPSGTESRSVLVAAGRAAATTPPPVAIVITSRYARQGEQYTTLAYTLVLKEVGCLFQALYLAAESLGLAACALGRNTPFGVLARLCNTTEIEEPVVGELAIGLPAD